MTETRELYAGDGATTVARPSGLQPPELETLIEWEAGGGCEAACPEGCWVEPDGICPHGNPPWLIVLGLIWCATLPLSWGRFPCASARSTGCSAAPAPVT